MAEYNSDRPQIILKEYGRNMQKLVNYVSSLETKEERSKYSEALIDLMKQVTPTIKDETEYAQKMWDDLHIMSDFKLDADGSFPVPEKELLFKKPKKMDHEAQRIRYRHYGKNIELLIDEAIKIEDKEEQDAAIVYIARLMGTFYSSYNSDNVDEGVIIGNIREISKGKLDFDIAKAKEEKLFTAIFKRTEQRPTKNTSNKKRTGGSFKRRKN